MLIRYTSHYLRRKAEYVTGLLTEVVCRRKTRTLLSTKTRNVVLVIAYTAGRCMVHVKLKA